MPFHIDFVQKGTKNELNSSRSPLKYLIEFGLRFVDLNSARNCPNFLMEFEYVSRIFRFNSSGIRVLVKIETDFNRIFHQDIQ